MNEIQDHISDVTDGNTVRIALKEGDVWDYATPTLFENASLSNEDDRLLIKVSGANDSSRFLVGAYDASGNYLSTESANKPIIDGNDQQPNNDYEGMVHSIDEYYVTIENLVIRDTWGVSEYVGTEKRTHGVKVEDSAYVNVRWVDTSDTSGHGILGDNCDFCKFNDNSVTEFVSRASGHCELEGGGGIVLQNSSFTEVKRNSVTDGWGEGIGINWNSDHNDVQDNFICSARSAALYLDRNADNNNISHNFICQSDEAAYRRGGAFPNCTDGSNGLRINNEAAGYGDDISEYNILHGNIMIGMSWGINLSSAAAGSYTKNNTITNNLMIDNDENLNTGAGSGTTQDNTYTNNASVIYDSEGDGCTHTGSALTGHGTATYTAWHDEAPSQASWQGAGDQIGNISLSKTTGWRSVADCDDFEMAWLAITTSSSAYDNASTESSLFDPDSTLPNTFIFMIDKNMGAMAYEDSPPIGGETGLYSVIGGSKKVTLGGTKKLTLSGE